MKKVIHNPMGDLFVDFQKIFHVRNAYISKPDC